MIAGVVDHPHDSRLNIVADIANPVNQQRPALDPRQHPCRALNIDQITRVNDYERQ